MKYCLNARQSEKYLEKADEIMIEARDYRITPDLLMEYPDKPVILTIDSTKISLKTLKNYSEMSNNFICRLTDLKEYYKYKEQGIKFYYAYPVNTYTEVKALMDIGVEYVVVEAPLTFDIELLKSLDMKFRMVPNVAYYDFIPRENGITGDYIRPEDVHYYEDAIYVFDFENVTAEQEGAMYEIYARGTWGGNLALIITNLNTEVRNALLPDDFGEFRSKCQQRCYNCHYCEAAARLAKTADNLSKELSDLISKK